MLAQPDWFRTVFYTVTNPQLGWHHDLLNDRSRTLAYLEAVSRTVQPGDVVADLGTGSGILALSAAQAGATEVFAVEYRSIVWLAKRIASVNRMSDRITFFNAHSSALELPRPVDVLVSECAESLGVSPMVRAFIEARPRWLKPGGCVIPARLRIYLVPVEAPKAYSAIALETAGDYGVNLAPLKEALLNLVFAVVLEPDQALAEPQIVHELDLTSAVSANVEAEVSFRIQRVGIVHGLGGWFEADLAPGVVLRTAPDAPQTVWHQAFLPLLEPQPVEPGDNLQVHLRIDVLPHEVFYHWDVRLERKTGSACAFEQSTLNSWPALPLPAPRFWERPGDKEQFADQEERR